MDLSSVNKTTLGLFIVGMILIIGSVLAYPDVVKDSHYTEVRQVDESTIRDVEEVHNFSELSPRAQEVFLNAVNSTDGVTTFTGESNQPAEFNYYDDEAWYTYVVYNSDHYTVSGWREDCLGIFCWLPLLGIGMMSFIGLLLVLFTIIQAKKNI